MAVKLVRAVQTSMACPSQWDAWDAEGNYYYLRFRHGYGQIRQYKTEDWVDSDEDELIGVVGEFEHGDPLDGSIELDEFATLAGIELDPAIYAVDYGTHLRDELIKDGLTVFLEGTGNPLHEFANPDEEQQRPEEGTEI
jgi:hypothetical protein